MRVQLLAFWGILYCAKKLEISVIDVYGDSKMILEWEN